MAQTTLPASQLQRFLSTNRQFLHYLMGQRDKLEAAIAFCKGNPFEMPKDVHNKAMGDLYKERRHLVEVYARASNQQRSVRKVLWGRAPLTHALSQSMQKVVTPMLHEMEKLRLELKDLVHKVYSEGMGRELFNRINADYEALNTNCFHFIQMQRDLRRIAGGQGVKVKKIGTKNPQ